MIIERTYHFLTVSLLRCLTPGSACRSHMQTDPSLLPQNPASLRAYPTPRTLNQPLRRTGTCGRKPRWTTPCAPRWMRDPAHHRAIGEWGLRDPRPPRHTQHRQGTQPPRAPNPHRLQQSSLPKAGAAASCPAWAWACSLGASRRTGWMRSLVSSSHGLRAAGCLT